MLKQVSILLIISLLFSCKVDENESTANASYSPIKISGAMRNVMWKGELRGIINLDTIANKKGLYGLGPQAFLAGELLINDGKSYVSKVLTDSTMSVEKTYDLEAPFFVYGNVNEWKGIDLPDNVKNIKNLETFIDQQTQNATRPFVFKLIGQITEADIHIQNLPPGTRVSSPTEAHQGQTNYQLKNEEVEIIGFFSTEHQGIFTHHDSFLHMHLITHDEKQMGHLDGVVFSQGKVKLFLPIK